MQSDSIRPLPPLRLVGTDTSVQAVAPKLLGTSALRLAPVDHSPRAPLHLSGRPAVDSAPIENEMRSAAGMSALDTRWILAVQVSRGLAGGRAAILTPETRQRLMSLGNKYGLRPFDASLVIAIVQDAARSGEDELGSNVVDRLRMVRSGPDLFARRSPHWADLFLHTTLIVAVASTFAYFMVRWIGV